MTTVALCIGSNLNNRKENIKKAVKLIEERFGKKTKKSSVYENPPFYETEDKQQDYFNCCVSFDTDLEPRKVFKITKQIETDMGRTRTFPNEPRIIDIDVLFVGDTIICDEDLVIPHFDMQERKFVLKPLSEILGDFIHPVLQMSVNDLLYECEDQSRMKKLQGFWDK